MTENSTDNAINYDQGDWIVHCHYGVGRIEDIEHKRVSDEENTYFRIKTADSVFWMPVEHMDTEQIRSIADERRFQEALEVLSKPANEMASTASKRKARIKQVTINNIPKETARLIRDLRARRREKNGLYHSEWKALRNLTMRFLQEWTVSVGLTMGQARRKLNRRLDGRKAEIVQKDLNNRKHKASTSIGTRSRRDNKWSEWVNQQLVKGT
jgi:RNA polymerase-interacting CarD/CdnL/TRCF family regulator